MLTHKIVSHDDILRNFSILFLLTMIKDYFKTQPTFPPCEGLILVLGRSLGEGNGNPLQYSCLGNSMDRGASWAAVHGVTKESDTT